MPFWTSFCWFMAGSVLFYILNSIMNSGMLIRMINSSVRHSLEILFVTHKSYVLSQELKYDFMRKNNIPEDHFLREKILVTGFSCRSQIKRLEGYRPLHPVQALLREIEQVN